jgi:hypothetical protein
MRISVWAGLAAAVTMYGAERTPKSKIQIFQTSDRCFACHNGLVTSSGEDISIGFAWRASIMANSGRDPYWQASVRRESLDHPESQKAIEDECSICHMPMMRYQAKANGGEGEVFAHLGFDADKPADRYAEDGVSCSLCHQITKDKLGTRESFVGGFVVDQTHARGEREEYGPFKIEAGQNRIMRTSSQGYKPTESDHIRQSELCATCHTLLTKALGPNGQVIGELPEQVPYQEWLNSEYKDKQSCQKCHMPVVEEPVPVTKVLGKPREGMSRHVFVGGNFFILRLLNRYRGDLSVWALPQELESAAEKTVQFLKTSTAQVSIERAELRGQRLEADIAIQNLSGHKFPTAYPSRRAWLHVTVRDRNNRVVFESGAIDAKGMIQGNDNAADPLKYEPHYTEITNPDQVQIYEAIMVDSAGKLTTGLLNALRYEKDNRLLPRGFDKRGADKDVAVQGGAAQDADFTGGGDKIRYSVAVGDGQGPFQVEAELWFQPISYRWANNLRPYTGEENKRFVGYYDELAPSSAVMIARAAVVR